MRDLPGVTLVDLVGHQGKILAAAAAAAAARSMLDDLVQVLKVLCLSCSQESRDWLAKFDALFLMQCTIVSEKAEHASSHNVA